MKLIVAVDNKWGIGRENGLLFNLKRDMRFFKMQTMGKTVVMGRKTLESFPGGRPLCGRENVVLTRNKDFFCNGVEIFNNIDLFLEKYNGKDVFVIGGAEIYAQLLTYCDTAYVTKIFADGKAERFFVNLDESEDWQLCDETPIYRENGIKYVFSVYTNKLCD